MYSSRDCSLSAILFQSPLETSELVICFFQQETRYNERTPMLGNRNEQQHGDSPIGFMGALRIPGVIEYSLCLFFSKLVNYTFLFWLPLYIKNTSE
jgi:hypothetical protein